MKPFARTPLHHWHASHGAQFKEDTGWQLVDSYGNNQAELEGALKRLAIADISGFAKMSLRGRGLATYLRSSFGVVEDLRLHQVQAPSERPKTLACRLGLDHLLVLGSAPDAPSMRDELFEPHCSVSIALADVTSAYAGFLLAGPHLESVLRRLTAFNVQISCFPVGTCAETAFARIEALLVRHAEFTVPSMRIYVPWDLGEYVWARIIEAGGGFGITPIGLDVVERLRLMKIFDPVLDASFGTRNGKQA